jgi:autotransporter-associated beta strand protein
MKSAHKYPRKLCFPRTLALTLGLALAGLTTQPVKADTTWTGATSQDWNDASNWSTGLPSSSNGAIFVPYAATYIPILSTDASAGGEIRIGPGSNGRLDQWAGTLSTGSSNDLYLGYGGANTSYNIANTGGSGGTFTGFGMGTGSLNVGGVAKNGKMIMGLDSNTMATLNVNTSGTLAMGVMYVSSAGGTSAVVNLDNGTVNVSGATQIGGNLWGNGVSGRLNMSGGTFNASGGMVVGITGGSGSISGTVNQIGGTINTTNLSVGKANGANSTVSVTNATINASSSVLVADTSNSGSQSGQAIHGTLNVNSGGTVNSENDFVGALGGNNSTGAVNIAAGGTINVGTNTKRWAMINEYDSAQGTLTVNGGNLNLNANTDLRFSGAWSGGGNGTSVANLNSGAITSFSGNQTGNGAGVLDMNGSSTAGANNTFNLNGGTLAIRQVVSGNNSGTAVFNFNGGTLKATGATANFLDLGGASQTTKVLAGGARIDSNGFNVAIPQALVSGVAGDGGLSKSGLGTLTLGAANTYLGATTVNGGVLALGAAGSISNSSLVDVKAGATFDTTAQSFSMLGGQTFKFTLDSTGAGSAGLLAAGGLNITNGVVDFATVGTLDDPAYVIASYSSLTGSQFASVLDLPAGYTVDYGYAGGTQVALIAAVPEPGTWAMLVGGMGMLTCLQRARRKGGR